MPASTVIEHWRRPIGRCRVKDRTGTGGTGGTGGSDGRRLVFTGEMRSSGVRVYRGGTAIRSAMCSREYLADALQARRHGRYPTINDRSR
jgi:hypothetical protein